MDSTLVRQWKDLTEAALPQLAREQGWTLRLDHCFKRVCLDNAVGGVWYEYIAKPAERHATVEQMERAIGFARQIASAGQPTLTRLNRRSLAWRGKGTGHASVG